MFILYAWLFGGSSSYPLQLKMLINSPDGANVCDVYCTRGTYTVATVKQNCSTFYYLLFYLFFMLSENTRCLQRYVHRTREYASFNRKVLKRTIMRTYGVSRQSIQRTMTMLASQRTVKRRKCQGTSCTHDLSVLLRVRGWHFIYDTDVETDVIVVD